jgi:hypothetical protein
MPYESTALPLSYPARLSSQFKVKSEKFKAFGVLTKKCASLRSAHHKLLIFNWQLYNSKKQPRISGAVKSHLLKAKGDGMTPCGLSGPKDRSDRVCINLSYCLFPLAYFKYSESVGGAQQNLENLVN